MKISYTEDCQRIVCVLEKNGYQNITLNIAQILWRKRSNDICTSWHCLPDYDEEILSVLLKYLPKSKKFKIKSSLSSILNKMIIEEIRFKNDTIQIKLTDARIFISPIKYFPELSKLTLLKRRKYTIVNDRTVLFKNANSVYHLEDFIGLEEKWKQR